MRNSLAQFTYLNQGKSPSSYKGSIQTIHQWLAGWFCLCWVSTLLVFQAVFQASSAYVCKGGKGGEVPPLRRRSPPQRFSTSLVRDVTQKKIFSLPNSPLSEIFFLPALFPPLKIFFCSLPSSPSRKIFFSPPYSSLTRNYFTNSLPTSPLTSLPTSPSRIFLVPHAFPPP